MKTLPAVLFLMLFSLAAVAQRSAPADTTARKFFVGVGASNASYHLQFDNKSLHGRFTPVSTVYAGYKFNSKLSLQIGFAYGARNLNSSATYYKSVDSTIYLNQSYRTQGFSMPITLRYNLLNLSQRLQFYGTASLIPTYGTAHQKHTETLDGNTTVTYNSKGSGFNLITTAGIGLNYRISNRLDGYGELLLLNRNLATFNIRPTQPNFGIGLNYRL